jgi:O-methyltransferase involved in polyketide biosynthesis
MLDSTNNLYQKYMAFNEIMLEEYKPLEIAAIMTIQGLTFYKSVLSEEDYQRMIKNIYDKRDEVKTFE